MIQFTYKTDDKHIEADQFLDLANKVCPGSYNKEITKEALSRTINITVWNDEKLIGCIRILTDGYFFGTITEILVDPNYQRLGIGRRLIELAWENSPTSIFFGAQPGNEIFFEKCGFEKSMQSYQRKKTRIT